MSRIENMQLTSLYFIDNTIVTLNDSYRFAFFSFLSLHARRSLNDRKKTEKSRKKIINIYDYTYMKVVRKLIGISSKCNARIQCFCIKNPIIRTGGPGKPGGPMRPGGPISPYSPFSPFGPERPCVTTTNR